MQGCYKTSTLTLSELLRRITTDPLESDAARDLAERTEALMSLAEREALIRTARLDEIGRGGRGMDND